MECNYVCNDTCSTSLGDIFHKEDRVFALVIASGMHRNPSCYIAKVLKSTK